MKIESHTDKNSITARNKVHMSLAMHGQNPDFDDLGGNKNQRTRDKNK